MTDDNIYQYDTIGPPTLRCKNAWRPIGTQLVCRCELVEGHKGPHMHGPAMWDEVTFKMNFIEDKK